MLSLRHEEFQYVESSLLTRLRTGSRSAKKNEVRIGFGGSTMIHALVKLDATQQPVAVDYFHIGGMTPGAMQHGIMEWVGKDARFCMAAAGQPRPADFSCTPGSGRTLSRWRPVG